MRNDQIFVLLLVILLPMSGCFDNSVGDAEGADGESSTTIENNYYDNTTNSVVMSVYIGEGQTHTITLNGTTLKLLNVYSNNNNGIWQNSGGSLGIFMDCENGFSMTTYMSYNVNYNSQYLPALPNLECEFTLNYQPSNSGTPATEKILIFSESELIPL